jgi:hypothetical protein
MWFSKKKLDVLSVGDVVTDAFIDLLDAQVHCDINNEDCTISMRFGDKIPYRDVIITRAVGNAANASVAARRFNLSSIRTLGGQFAGLPGPTFLPAPEKVPKPWRAHSATQRNFGT